MATNNSVGTVIFILASNESTTPLTVTFEDPEKDAVCCEPAEGAAPLPRPLQVYEGKPCIQWAVGAAAEIGIEQITVLTSQKLKDAIQPTMANAPVKVVVRDFAAERASTKTHDNFEAFNMPYGLLNAMKEIATNACPAYKQILVLACDQVRIDANHLKELLDDAARHESADIVTSWITFFPHMPMLLRRAFLDRLDKEAAQPLRHLNVYDHLFGEETLAANSATPKAVENYLESKAWEEKEPAPETELSSDLAWADAFGQRCKLDFPLLAKTENRNALIYLDNAATTQRCSQALLAQQNYDTSSNANVYRGTYELSASSTAAFARAHEVVESFIGAEPKSVAFAENTSSAIARVLQAWGPRNLKAGDTIAVALSEHHSTIVALLSLAKQTGAKLEYLPYDQNGRIDEAAFTHVMKQHPKLVCLAHVGNVFGIANPISDLAAEAHAVGARVLVDAAQSFAHIPIDVKELGADWLVFSGHKVYGPMGSGGIWSSEDAVAEMEPLSVGGGTVAHVSQQSYYLRPYPIQFELGTPNVSAAVGLAAALEYLNALGMENVRRHEAILTRHLADRLQDIDGITIAGDHSQTDGQLGLLSFTLAGSDSMDIVGFLASQGICMRGGGHCALPLHASLGLSGTVRASMGVYTTLSDVETLADAIQTYARLVTL